MEGFTTIELMETDRLMYLPNELAYCDERQYIAMCDLIYQLETKAIDTHLFKRMGIYALLNLEEGDREIPKEEWSDALCNIDMLGELLVSFFEENEEAMKVKLTYNGNKLRKLKPLNTSYYGPSDYYYDVDFGEYKDGLHVLFMYEKTRDVELLYRLMAIFFRKKKLYGKREKYNDATVEKRIKLFKRYPLCYPLAFYYNFVSFHNYFTSSGVMYEGKAIDLSIIFTDQPEDEPGIDSPYPSLGMQSIAFQIAESNVFGSEDQVNATNLWKIVLQMYDMRKRDLDGKIRRSKDKKES